jgi:hypothetical protein
MNKYNHTEIEPIALALTLAMGIAMLLVRRDRAAVPLLIVACLVTHAQRIVILGFDFSMLRIIILFGWARLFYRGEINDYRYHPLDGALLVWQFFATIAYIFGPRGSMDAFILRLGGIMDAAGTYFLFRILLRDVKDIQRTVMVFSWLAIVMVGPMIIEHLTGHNLFSALGGVNKITTIRAGRLRCQASFSHPIMAGNFGASTAALLGALWLAYPAQRVRYSLALLAATGVTILSSSSGPLFAFITAIIGWALWPCRRYMRMIRWGTLALLLIIHFARDQPVWHLIGRMSALTGGTGWHRVTLINAFIEHFNEWWFLGAYTTEHWKAAQGNDITNQYILEGVRGGLVTLIAFIAVLVIGFRAVGESLRLARRSTTMSPFEVRRASLVAWGLGVCLASHCMAFIGVSYFGQLLSILYLHLAMIPSLAKGLARRQPRKKVRRKKRSLSWEATAIPRGAWLEPR